MLMIVAALLAGCGAQLSQAPVIGIPEEAPRAPAAAADFPSAGVSGARAEKPMNAEERAKLEQDLRNAREHAAAERRKRIEEESRRR